MDSDSDCAFESADEEIEIRRGTSTNNISTNKNRIMSNNFKNSAIDSDSDDDNEFVTTNVNAASWSTEISDVQNKLSKDVINKQQDNIDSEKQSSSLSDLQKRKKPERKQKINNKPAGLGAKKLGSKIVTDDVSTIKNTKSSDELSIDVNKQDSNNEEKNLSINQECWEFNDEEAMKILQKESQKGKIKWSKSKDDVHDDIIDVPEELKSNKSFKEVFNDKKIEKQLSQEKIKSVLEKIPSVATTPDDSSSSGWGSWGSWGVNSLINTASIGVSTISSHVSHGLTLLEETMNVPDTENVEEQILQSNEKKITEEEKVETPSQDNQDQQGSSFGFGNFMYGVSSITKLVESTGSKVINGGLETLETIGKKTMEVLQDGDPGLKKKRAFFMNEGDKPILSQMLREAKDKAEIEEKSIEGKEFARKVHFEILFDDFQGLVHLEALEMLSKQCIIKIQQKLVTLDLDDMNSIQETLDEIKELCDLGDEDEEEEDDNDNDNENDKNLKDKLNNSCKDLGVDINYDKINEIWEESKLYIESVSKPDISKSISDLEIFVNAISTLAKFTAVSVERFHKTAELLLIKERRSTVNEADALVQLTKILSGQIGTAASLFSKCLNERIEKYNKSSDTVDITTIFLEATNASSYIQDAFRLLMPILQVGAI